ADHEHRPEREHGEGNVEDWPRCRNRDAAPDRRGRELARLSLHQLRLFSLARIEKLDVAAERNCADRVFDAVTADARPQRFAESDRKAQHPDAAAPGDPEVAELVECYEDAEGDQQPPYGTENVTHLTVTSFRRLAASSRKSGNAPTAMAC